MDRSEQLKSFTDEELLNELNERIARYQVKMQTLIDGLGPQREKNFRKSQAKAKYWQGWHEYRAKHPDANVSDWRKAKLKRESKVR